MAKFFSNKKGIFRHKLIMLSLILLSIVIGAGWLATGYLGDMARQGIIKDNESAISILSVHLTEELKKLDAAVKALSGSPSIAPALISRKDQDIEHANSALDRYNSALDASVTYLMDCSGMTIASSNRSAPDSFVGKSYHFRPYYTQAKNGYQGRYFALGITSLKRGFYTSYPVQSQNGKIIGVVAMKKDLDEIETNLSNYPYSFFVNKHGIIFLSGEKKMLFKSLWPISQETQRELIASKQFGEKPLETVLSQEVVNGMNVTLKGNNYFVSRKVIDPEGWSVVLLTPTDRIGIYKSIGVIMTVLICLLLMIPLIVTHQTIKTADIAHKSEERFQQVADSSQDWIWETDEEGRYAYSSQAVENILGYKPEEIIGKHYYDFFIPDEKEQHIQTAKKYFKNKKSFFRGVNRNVHRDGYEVFLESTGVPVFNNNKVIGYRGTSRDITDRQRAEEKLRESEKRLHSVIQGSPLPIFVIGKDHRIIHWNKALEELSGIKAEEAIGTTQHWKVFYNTERPCLADLVVDKNWEAISLVYSGKYSKLNLSEEAYDAADFFPDLGEEGKWLRFTAVGIKDSQGDIFGAIEILEDITERKKAEKALQESEELYRILAEKSFAGVYVVQDGKFRFINSIAASYAGYKREELTGQESGWIVHPEDREQASKNAGAMLRGELISPYEFRIITKKGEIRWVMETITSIYYEGERAILGNSMDITDRKRAEEEMIYLSMTDPLTDLHNRRGFITLAEHQLKISKRGEGGMLLFFADLDGMKQINDTLGHEEGDRALIDSAMILKETFRTSDIIARMGGDEFAILAIDTTGISPEVIMTRLQNQIDKHNSEGNRFYNISISMGTSYYDPENPCSLDELMSRADKLMYEHKKSKKT